MRRASSKVAKQTPDNSTQAESFDEDLGFFNGTVSGETQVPIQELPSNDTGDDAAEEKSFEGYESKSNDNVLDFNDSDLTANKIESISAATTAQSDSGPFLGLDTNQLIFWIGGGVLLVVGGLVMLSRLSRKTKKSRNNYRAPVEKVDHQREVRGQFKPSERFKKPKIEQDERLDESLDVLPDHVGVSNLVGASDVPTMQGQSPSDEEEFDFSADMDEAEFELFESDELAEAETETPEVSNQAGSLSARPPESHQQSDFSFVESAGSLNRHFVQSSAAPIDAAELEYFGTSKSDLREENSFAKEDEGFFGESDLESELPQEDLVEAVSQGDVAVEHKIESSQSARDFSGELLDHHPVHANSEDEEAVMNLQDDDSDLEFNFDLSEEVEIDDSDADFNFELDDDGSIALSEDASEIAIQPAAPQDAPVVVDQPVEPIVSDAVAEAEASIEVEADPAPAEVVSELDAVSELDDSAEFADMFEDSSEDLGGLGIDAPAEAVEQVELDAESVADSVTASVSESVEDLGDPVAGISAAANDMADDVDFSGIELDESIQGAVGAVAEPLGDAGLGGVVDSVGDVVGDAVGGITETAQGATEAVTEAVGGISDTAKATAVAAGAAGAAAGGGMLSKLFGWGKKKKAADVAEDAVAETTEQISELAEDVASPAEQIVEETFNEVTDIEVDGAADVGIVESEAGDEAEFSFADDGEIEIVDEAANDEFDFDIEDDDAPAIQAAQTPAAEAEIEAVDIDPVDVDAEIDVAQDAGIDLEDDDEFDFSDDSDLAQSEIDDDEFSFGDPELDSDDQKKSFSSMETLREPEPPADRPGFSSADTIREPEKVVEAESDGLGVAALGGTLAAGAAAALALNTSPAEPVEADDSQSAPASGLGIFDGSSDEEAADDSKTSELEAKIKELQQANQELEESTKTLEEKLEASLAESEKALQEAEQEHAAKLEANSTEQSELAAKLEASSTAQSELEAKLEASSTEQSELAAKLEASSTEQSELAAELESVKSELSEAKTSAEEAAKQAAEEAAAKAASEKQADLEKLQAELKSAQSNTTALNDELKSVKQQLADAVANQGDQEGMPTSSLMAAAGLGAAGLGAAGLMGAKGSKSDDADSSGDALDHTDLKKRFESRLKAERQARKDAQSHLEQAEEQRNEIAQALRGLKKEMAELKSKAAGESEVKKKTMNSKKKPKS